MAAIANKIIITNGGWERSRMDFAFHGSAWDLCMVRFDDGLARALEAAGHRRVLMQGRGPHLVLAHIDPQDPKVYRRPDSGVFVVSLLRLPRPPDNLDGHAHAWIVRTLANLMIVVAGPDDQPAIYVRTPDRTLESIGAPAWSPALYAQLMQHLSMLDVHLVVDNIFDRDLEPELRQGGDALPAMRRAAARLAELGALTSGPPVGDMLAPQELRHLQRLYQGSRMSSGNLSQRHDARRFWMSTSGVDWAQLGTVGRDVELVKGYDPGSRALLISVPPGVRPRRVSSDALTHHLVYRSQPGVGAIAHLHAWFDDVQAVGPDYARGSLERAHVVASLVQEAADPFHAIVGIERHGVIVTGETLDEIVQRVSDRGVLPVPCR